MGGSISRNYKGSTMLGKSLRHTTGNVIEAQATVAHMEPKLTSVDLRLVPLLRLFGDHIPILEAWLSGKMQPVGSRLPGQATAYGGSGRGIPFPSLRSYLPALRRKGTMISRPTAEEMLSQIKAEEEQAEEEHCRAEEAQAEYAQLRDAFSGAGAGCLKYRLEEELGRKATLDEFCAHWAERIVELGRVLLEKGLAHRLDELAPESRAKMYALEILRRGIEGRTEEVNRLLREVAELTFGGEVSDWLRGRLEAEILQYRTLAVTGTDGICRPVFQEFEVVKHPSDLSEVPDDPELYLQRNWPLDEAAKKELVEWSKRLRDWKRRWNAAGRNPSPSEYSVLTEERRRLEADLYLFNLQHDIVEPPDPPSADPVALLRKKCFEAYDILDLLELTPIGRECFKETEKAPLTVVRNLYRQARRLVQAGIASAPPEEPGPFTDKGAAFRAIDRLLQWLAVLSAPPIAAEATPQVEERDLSDSHEAGEPMRRGQEESHGNPPVPHPDGPEPPHWLWFGNVRHRIGTGRSRLSWQLLNHFWTRDSAAYEDLQGLGMPWSDPVTDSAIATAVNRFNNEMPTGFPWKLTTKNRCVAKESRENPVT
jgi:hypothetical protein